MNERLQKIIAAAGIASRRAAESLILEGLVSVNGEVVTELGRKADPSKDVIRVRGVRIAVDTEKVYLMVHKPAGYLTAMSDNRGRKTTSDLVSGFAERLVPVGRLDYASEGLLIVTNDGEFSYRVQHPKFKLPKTYRVKLQGSVTPAELGAIRKGASLSDGFFKPLEAAIDRLNRKSAWITVTIVGGRNRVLRRYFEALGFPVRRLVRVAIAGLKLGDLKPGDFRPLKASEIRELLGGGGQ
ncbi:MAG: pseudouridine synthase [Syntrophales bacterium]|nr:pseudouridine synthase [Syntrophales bacterium]